MARWRILLGVLVTFPAGAEPDHAQSVAVNFGLIQPLVLGGGNVEVDYRRGALVVGYSHGWSLDLQGATVVGEPHDQHLRLHLPYSTGLGVGLQHDFTTRAVIVDARAELKLHRFEPALEDASGSMLHELPAYRTVTVGAGVYATWMPWHRCACSLDGVDASASVRWWPNVWDSLGDGYPYLNTTTGRMETMHAANIGIANTPLVINVSIGYVFE
jgi:hypothetical protein